MSSPVPNLLGFIIKRDRTNDQIDAHARAELSLIKHHALAPTDLPKGQAVRLFDAWKHPKVIADVGFLFRWFYQLTGSCVGAGGGQSMFTLIALQRLLSTNPTKAFLPFWPFNYGRSRLYMGDRGQGEGSLGSTFFKSLLEDGVISASEPNLPKFTINDNGIYLTSGLEMKWSDGDSQLVMDYADEAKAHPLKAGMEVKDVSALKSGIINGYPATWACNNFIGNAVVKGSGNNARVMGRWGGRGGHQQAVLAYENNEEHGPIYWVQNNWAKGTYPADPAGGPTCGCWVLEKDVEAAFRLDSEVYLLSSLDWFPAQPDVPEVFSWVF